MLDAGPLIQRLRDQVTELRSVDGALEMAALMRAKTPLVGRPIAHVIATGARGQRADVATGVYSQPVDLAFAVILTIPVVNDATGARAAATVDRLIRAIVQALVGWAPDSAPGVVQLGGWQLARFDAEVIAVSIDFSITDLLRA